MADEPIQPDQNPDATPPEQELPAVPEAAVPEPGPQANEAELPPVGADEPTAAAPADEPGTPVADSTPTKNTFDQAELDALTAELAAQGADGSAEASSTPRNTFDQSELDALASQLEAATTTASTAAGDAADAEAAVSAQAEVDSLAAEMAAAIAAEQGDDVSAAAGRSPAVVGDVRVTASPEDAQEYEAADLGAASGPADGTTIDMLDDVELDVKIELGRTAMYIEDVLRLGVGAVVELDKLAGDPVDIYVNNRLIARGEVLVLNDNFCVRINDIHSPIPELENGA